MMAMLRSFKSESAMGLHCSCQENGAAVHSGSWPAAPAMLRGQREAEPVCDFGAQKSQLPGARALAGLVVATAQSYGGNTLPGRRRGGRRRNSVPGNRDIHGTATK